MRLIKNANKLKKIFFRRKLISIPVSLAIVLGLGLFVYVNFARGATYTWDGGGDSISCPGEEYSWSCAQNWSSDIVPTSADIAQFNNTSDKVATVNASFAGSVAGVNVASGYDGTITQSRSLTVGASSFVQASGTWDGTNQDLTISNDGSFTVSAGTHYATTGTWSVDRNFTYSGGTLDMTGATVSMTDFDNLDNATLSCSGGGGTLGGTVNVVKNSSSDFTLAAGCTATFGTFQVIRDANTSAGDVVINGTANGTDMTIYNSLTVGAAGVLNFSGTIYAVDNNSVLHDTSISCTGDLGVTVDVTKNEGTDFTLGTGCTADFGNLEVSRFANATAGILTINGTANGTNVLIHGDMTIGTSGALNLSGTITVADNSSTLQDSDINCTGTIAATMNITKDESGDFTLGSGCAITTGTFQVYRNAVVAGGAITINGRVTGTSMTMYNNLTIGAGGSASMSGTINFNGNQSAHDSTLTCNGNIIDGDVVINKSNASSDFILGTDCRIPGSFTRTDGPFTNPSSAKTLIVEGNFSMSTSDTFGGTNLTLEMDGDGAQTITRNAGTMGGNFSVNSSGGTVTLASSFSPGGTCDIYDGTLDLAGNTFSCTGAFTLHESEDPDTTSSLYAHWKMDENSGSNVADSSGNARNATATGTSVVAGPTGYDDARSFNGTSSDYISGPATEFDNFTGGFTVSFWAYPTSNGSYERFIDFAQGQADDNILLARNSTSSNLTFEVYSNTTSGGQVTAVGAITNNAWHHYAATVDSSGRVVIYKDGERIATGTTAVPANVVRDQVYIGRSAWAADAYYAGYMDDVRIFSRALSENDMLKLYDNSVTQMAATLELFGSETVSTPTLNTGSTVKYTGDSGADVDNYTLKSFTYANLEVASVDAGDTYASPSTMDVNGDFTLSNGAFTAPSGNFTLAGDFTRSGGSFVHNSGSMIFDGADQALTNSNTFNNFYKSSSSESTFEFEAGETQTILGSFTVRGTRSLISLLSSDPDTPWEIDPQGTRDCTCVAVSDSNNLASSITATGRDDGGNTAWSITPDSVCIPSSKVRGGVQIRGGTRVQ